MLILVFGVDYRYVQAGYIDQTLRFGFVDLPLRMLVPCVLSLLMLGAAAALPVAHLHRPRHHGGVAGPARAAAHGGRPDPASSASPSRISIATASLAGAFLIIIQPVEPSVGREYIGRVFAICVLGGLQSLPGTVIAAMLLGIVESITATFYGPSWAPAVAFGFLLLTLAFRPAGLLGTIGARPCVHRSSSIIASAWSARRSSLLARWIGNDYLFFAGYTVLQFIVLATAWNILGGYCGYVNFGSAAFFAVGAYSSVALHKLGTNIDRYFSGSARAAAAS